MTLKARTLWIGMASTALVAVLVAAGFIVWLNQGPHRYTTMAELNSAINTAAGSVTSYRSVYTSDWQGDVPSHSRSEMVTQRDGSGVRYQLTASFSSEGSPGREPTVVLVTPEGAWVSASVLTDSERASLPAGKSWIVVDPASSLPLVKSYAETAGRVRTQPVFESPFNDAYQILEAAKDHLDGIRTYRYSLRRDLARAAELEDNPTLKGFLQESVREGEKTTDSRLWMDAEDRPLRTSADLKTPGSRGVSETRYSDWGADFHIASPPADQVWGG